MFSAERDAHEALYQSVAYVFRVQKKGESTSGTDAKWPSGDALTHMTEGPMVFGGLHGQR